MESYNDKHTVMPVTKANSIAQRIMNENSGAYEDEGLRAELKELVETFINQPTHPGDADDFHNFSVALAIADEYDLAADILDCGLKYFPKNVDLLADYLQDGMSCGRQERCAEIYEILSKIPHRLWTWRGFSFSIIYLLQTVLEYAETDEQIDMLEKTVLALAAEYRKLFPDSEEGYRVEAVIYEKLKNQKGVEEILKKALNELGVCPKCALMYADMLFKRGDYAAAETCIKRSIGDSSQTRTSVNSGYLYLMSALCKIASAQKNDTPLTDKDIDEIYLNLNIALSVFDNSRGQNNEYKDIIKDKCLYLTGRYPDMRIPENYEYLYKFIQDLKV